MFYDGTKYFYQLNLQGDVIGIVDTTGASVAKYAYDAWGRVVYSTGTMAAINPIRYRGYYYDAELGMYYLGGRYYDPQVKRFVNADHANLIAANTNGLTDKNLFSYCDNNPVGRKYIDGGIFDTVLDIASLVTNVIDIVKNPSNPIAWVSLAADAISLAVPGVTGVEKIVKAAANIDDIVDTAKTVYKAADKASDLKRATGSYEILYKSGKNYVGKGGFGRAINSAQRYTKKYGDKVTAINWSKSANSRQAFIAEYKRMSKRGVRNESTYNKI